MRNHRVYMSKRLRSAAERGRQRRGGETSDRARRAVAVGIPFNDAFQKSSSNNNN